MSQVKAHMFTRRATITALATNRATEPVSITDPARGMELRGRGQDRITEIDKLADWLVKLKTEAGGAEAVPGL